MKYKKYIIMLVFSIVIFLVLMYVYKNVINKDNLASAYIAISDIKKGDKPSTKNLKKIYIDFKDYNENSIEYLKDLSGKENFVFNNDIKCGNIISEKTLIKENEYTVDSDYEYISLKVENSEDSSSYNIKKGNHINVYCTAKTDQLEDIINFYSDKKFDIFTSGAKESYTTVNILKDVEVVDSYNKFGVSMEDIEKLGTDTVVDTVMIKLKKEEGIRLSNIKRYGKISLTLIA